MEGLGRLGAHLPLAWIEEALEQTGTASIRRRRLPAEQVVWLVIALALYRSTSMSEVLESLDLALPNGDVSAVSRQGISQARQRIGAEPLAILFERTARAWSALDAAKHTWKGLSLWAMDGTTFRTPDSPENRAFFGAQGYASGKAASYPQVRGVSLTALSTRILAEVAFGAYDTNEMRYAEEVVPRIPDHSLTVFDKGFFSAAILLGLSLNGTERHFLVRALHYIQHDLLFAAATRAHGNIPGMLKRLRKRLKEALKEERRGRQCPRHVKSRPSKYDVRFVLKTPK